MVGWMLAGLLALSGTAPAPDDTAAPIPPAQVMALPPDLRARLDIAVLAGHPSQHARLDRLLHLVFDAGGLTLAYQDDATLSVADAYATRTANCLSFTLLFLALARAVGLDASPQEIRETLAWHEDNGIFYRVDHINAVVRIGDRGYVVDIAGDSVIALRPAARVSDGRLLGHFYDNLAMRDLEQGRLASALRNMAVALDLDPTSATNWSNAGVLHLHNGDADAAARAYARALALEPRNAGALANMANLAQRRGDRATEQALRERLEREQQGDPFFHFVQGFDREHAGDHAGAIAEYRHAIRLHAGEPRFHAALAHCLALAGDVAQARKAYARAEWLSTGAARAGYRAQREALPAR